MTRKNETTEKYISVTYHSDGKVDIQSNAMTVFDLWALSRFLDLRADEMYITTQTAERMKEANQTPRLVTPDMMPGGVGRIVPNS